MAELHTGYAPDLVDFWKNLEELDPTAVVAQFIMQRGMIRVLTDLIDARGGPVAWPPTCAKTWRLHATPSVLTRRWRKSHCPPESNSLPFSRLPPVQNHSTAMHEKLPVLDPCPKCKGPAQIKPAVKRGLFIAACEDHKNCAFSPVTETFPSEVEASDAWNRREFMQIPQGASTE